MSFKIIKKYLITIFVIFFISVNLIFAETYSKQQLIPADHWIYDALYTLYMEEGRCSIADMAPLSVKEIEFYLHTVDYEHLSVSGKKLYENIESFFEEEKISIDLEPVKIGFNLMLRPELMYKSNEEISWSYGTDYTNKNGEEYGYGTASSYYGNQYASPFILLPLYIDFSDLLIIETDASISKNFWAMTEPDNFTNIFWKGRDFEFSWPKSANASTGYLFQNGIGVNFHAGRAGLQIGKTKTGSLIYNKSFYTDFYVDFSIYSKNLKYSMNVSQISNRKYIYLHTIEASPWKWLKASVTEGTLLNQPFELRYLNPLMIMHSFASWDEYTTPLEEDIYGEAYVGQYMGINVEVTPCKYLRIYGNYAVTETQSVYELGNPTANAIPDGLGGQFGIDLTLPDNKHFGWYKANVEGIYTTPFLYVKQGANWSFYKDSHCMQRSYGTPYNSWIGSPFGSDAFGIHTSFAYDMPTKFALECSYLYLAHGENSFGMFNKKMTIDDVEYSAYYPSVLYKTKEYIEHHEKEISPEEKAMLLNADEAEKIARSYKLSGVVQYTNQIKLKGWYQINEHCKLDSQIIYYLIINNQNKKDNFAHGLEIDLGLDIKLF